MIRKRSDFSAIAIFWDAKLNNPLPALRLLREEKEPKPKLLGPDILRWGGGLPREGVGAEKFGMSRERGNRALVIVL